MEFFDQTPLGRIINRFSKDIEEVDSDLPATLRAFSACFFGVLWTYFCVHFSGAGTIMNEWFVWFVCCVNEAIVKTNFTTFSCPKVMKNPRAPLKRITKVLIDSFHQTLKRNFSFSVLAIYFATFCAWLAGLQASVLLHKSLLSNILRCPMDFFDVTPTGRLLARFSHDINTLDDRLIQNMRQCLITFFRVRWISLLSSVDL